jgi:hypothetical protein
MTRQLPLILVLGACHSACAADPPPRPVALPVKEAAIVNRAVTVDDLPRLVWRAGANATFAPTTTAERAAVARLVPALLAGTGVDKLAPDAAAIGMRIERWTVDDADYWVLIEHPEQRRGTGAYLFRVGATDDDRGPAILLEAPHAEFDQGTGEIAGELFFHPPPGKRPVALFLNTMHRYQIAPGRKQKRADSPADVAHNPDHMFTAATDAAAAALGEVEVIQIHGFANSADESEDAALPAGTLMVVSAGDARGSSPLSGAIAAALKARFGDGVRRFPEDSRALGATTNVQGRTLAARKGARFVHIESSADMRQALRTSPKKLEVFGSILFNTR